MAFRLPSVLAAAALTVPGAAAGAAAPPSVGLVTEIIGRGAVAVTVHVPRVAEARDFRLFVRGGTYAVVRLVPARQPDCDPGAPNCLSWDFRYLPELARVWAPAAEPGSGRDHAAIVPDPSRLPPGPLRAYVVTDGTVTLRMGVADGRLPAATRVTARDPVRAAVRRIPLACGAPCAGPVRSEVGGSAFDLGGPGYVEFIAARFDAGPGGRQSNASHAAVGCFYPNPADPAATPDPRQHPDSCDSTPDTPGDAGPTAANTVIQADQTVRPSTAQTRSEWWTGARGAVYIGGVTRSVSPSPSRGLLVGVWIRDSPPR